jgi:hypothetical protein
VDSNSIYMGVYSCFSCRWVDSISYTGWRGVASRISYRLRAVDSKLSFWWRLAQSSR